MFKKNFEIIDGIYVFNSTEKTGLKVIDFYKDDPFPNYENNENKISIMQKGDKNLYTQNLKSFIGNNKKVLEVGAGTCQLSNYLAIGNNNLIVAFDINFNSLKIGKKFAKEINLKNIIFVCGDIFDDIFIEEQFDVVLCNGVLHHTKNTFKSFGESIKWVKKNGYILLGLYNKIGRIRTFIRKYLQKLFGKKYLMIFDPVLRNINKDSTKKINAWIKDQYFHPVERSHTFDEVLKWFKHFNLSFVNSFPSCNLDDNKDELHKLFYQASSGNYISRIFKQIIMLFSKPGSEGGLFIFLAKK